MKINKSLSLKLFVFLLITGLAIFVPLTVTIIITSKSQLEKQVLESSRLANKIILRSFRYSMLLNDRDAISIILNAVKKIDDVEKVRIYGKNSIAFSTDENEMGKKLSPTAYPCTVCHASKPTLLKVPPGHTYVTGYSESGYRTLTKIDPIYNSRSCDQSGCHPPPSEQKVMERLGNRVSEIGRILTVIKDVADETNLLALNAAIISAQAGEQGRAFTVVADEIKDLAQRTKVSTAEVAKLIQDVRKDASDAVAIVRKSGETVEEGVHLSGEAGEALHKIQKSVRKTLDMANDISEATRDQSRQADQVLSFFEDIAGMVEEINAATQEQTRGSEQIFLAAEKMQDISTRVKKATHDQTIKAKQVTEAIEQITEIATYINSFQGEQREAAAQVTQASSRIAQIALQNVEGVENVSESVSNLQLLADEFRTMIDNYDTEEESSQ